VDGGIRHTKILAWRPLYARHLAGFKRADSQRGKGGNRKDGRGTEREKRDRKEENGRGGEESWNRAADWLRPALSGLLQAVYTNPKSICCGFAAVVLKLNFGFPNLGNGSSYGGGPSWCQMGVSQ